MDAAHPHLSVSGHCGCLRLLEIMARRRQEAAPGSNIAFHPRYPQMLGEALGSQQG